MTFGLIVGSQHFYYYWLQINHYAAVIFFTKVCHPQYEKHLTWLHISGKCKKNSSSFLHHMCGFTWLLPLFRSKELQSETVDLRERIKHLNDMVFCQQRKVKGMIEEVRRVYLFTSVGILSTHMYSDPLLYLSFGFG